MSNASAIARIKASIAGVLGYTPVNKAGDTMTGNLEIGYNGYPAVKFRDASGNLKGEMYLGTTAGDLNLVVNGAARITADASGRVTMPYQPFLFLQQSSVPYSAASNSPMGYDTVVKARSLSWDNTNKRFTAPVAGVYLFNFGFRLATTTLNYIYAQICINGSQYGNNALALSKPNQTDSFQSINGSIAVYANANDYLDIRFNWSGGSTFNIEASGQSWLSVSFLG